MTLLARYHREDPSALIEAVFRRIHRERMEGLPFLNPALSVAAVGFVRHGQDWRGILLTPWVMSLLLLPAVEDWPAPAPLERTYRSYPAGTFAFLPNEEAGVGIYLSCPLISDMMQFDGQETALMTARECLVLLDRVSETQQKESAAPVTLSRRGFITLSR